MKEIYEGDMADDFNSDSCNSLKKQILEKAIVKAGYETGICFADSNKDGICLKDGRPNPVWLNDSFCDGYLKHYMAIVKLTISK